jgi:hypothetical protein
MGVALALSSIVTAVPYFSFFLALAAMWCFLTAFDPLGSREWVTEHRFLPLTTHKQSSEMPLATIHHVPPCIIKHEVVLITPFISEFSPSHHQDTLMSLVRGTVVYY